LISSMHMTGEARHFRTAPDPALLPLWEAKHAALLDHRGGSREAIRYWIAADQVQRRFAGLTGRGWLAGYRNVTTSDAPRTLLPTALPVTGVGNSLPLISAPELPLLLAVLAALPTDYLVRQKHIGANLNFFKLEQVPVPPPAVLAEPAPWCPGRPLRGWLLDRFAAACAWHGEELAGLRAELAGLGVAVPAADDGRRRRLALAELDAALALLLGWDRGDLRHVLTGFGALHERDRRAGIEPTADLVLAAYDGLA
jgi:hypothetical protein